MITDLLVVAILVIVGLLIRGIVIIIIRWFDKHAKPPLDREEYLLDKRQDDTFF